MAGWIEGGDGILAGRKGDFAPSPFLNPVLARAVWGSRVQDQDHSAARGHREVFDRELREVKEAIVRMGERVAAAIDASVAALTASDVAAARAVIAADGATVGVGMGQVNRVDAARLAVERGGDRVRGAVAASDAFFPFPDGLETLTGAGVKAIVHPGGSVRDDEVTAAAAKAGVTVYLTGARHFAH